MRIRPWLAIALGILAGAANGGCAREADEEPIELLVDKEPYIDAIVAVSEPTFPITAEENRCIVTKYVDVLGFEDLVRNVTPQEIRDNPDASLEDWGVALDEPEAEALYDGMQECADMEPAFVKGVIQLLPMPPGADDECLTDGLDPDLVEDVFVSAYSGGMRSGFSEDLANAMYDWLAPCVDMKAMALSSFTEAGGAPPELAGCMDERVDDAMVKRFWIAAFVDPGDVESEPIVEELGSIAQSCVLENLELPGSGDS